MSVFGLIGFIAGGSEEVFALVGGDGVDDAPPLPPRSVIH